MTDPDGYWIDIDYTREDMIDRQISDDDSRSCAEFIPAPVGYTDPIPYRAHSSAWPVRYALTEEALRALADAGEL